MFFYHHSEYSIRDLRPICHPLFCHSSVVKYMRLVYKILLKSPHLALLAGSAPVCAHCERRDAQTQTFRRKRTSVFL